MTRGQELPERLVRHLTISQTQSFPSNAGRGCWTSSPECLCAWLGDGNNNASVVDAIIEMNRGSWVHHTPISTASLSTKKLFPGNAHLTPRRYCEACVKQSAIVEVPSREVVREIFLFKNCAVPAAAHSRRGGRSDACRGAAPQVLLKQREVAAAVHQSVASVA